VFTVCIDLFFKDNINYLDESPINASPSRVYNCCRSNNLPGTLSGHTLSVTTVPNPVCLNDISQFSNLLSATTKNSSNTMIAPQTKNHYIVDSAPQSDKSATLPFGNQNKNFLTFSTTSSSCLEKSYLDNNISSSTKNEVNKT
jgi:hypothetical protein